MMWIIQFVVRNRTPSALVVAVVLCLWMLSANTAQQERVSRALLLSVFYPLNYTLSTSKTIRNIFSENKRLRTEVANLQLKTAALSELSAENRRLRELIGFQKRFPYDLIPARVLMHDPSAGKRAIVIDAGSNQGLIPLMPVIAQKGVVGRIFQVLPTISVVQLLSDPDSRTSVMVQRNRTIGILKTHNGRDFLFSFRSHLDITEGDTVVTSGLGGIYPPDLEVGIIKSIATGGDPLFKQAFVSISADLDRIEEVFVIRLAPQWAAFRREVDSVRWTP